jgi:predicted acylesterase/phospholipase RssA
MKPKIAIACQGGGSQTAFTAGVLHALSEDGRKKAREFLAARERAVRAR